MLFLWIFGSAVEDRLGRGGFLGFYLIGGTVAGVAHMMVSNAPVIGASGSVAAVTGAFLALFPRSTIKVLLFFILIGIFHIPALWFIGFFFIIDVLRQGMDFLGGTGSGVAYMAHIAGYVYGFSLAFLLLAMRIVKRQDVDIFFLFTQARRRAEFRAAQRNTKGAMWDQPARADTERDTRERKQKDEQTLSEQDHRLAEGRAEISRLMLEHDLEAAAERYAQLLVDEPRTVFDEQRQVDLANQLYATGKHETAAQAYELFLEAYPRTLKAAEVRLILGMLYAKRLGKPDRARELLEAAKAKLNDQKQADLAGRLLAELGT
jgi:hypothetical protein